jgi:hypothetical protein
MPSQPKISACDSGDDEIPPYLRAPEKGTRLATENMLYAIDAKIAKLAKLGLRPHPTMVGYRQELVEQLESGGPYRIRVTAGVF